MQNNLPAFPYLLYPQYNIQPELINFYLNTLKGDSESNEKDNGITSLLTQVNNGLLASITSHREEAAKEIDSHKNQQSISLQIGRGVKREKPKADLSEISESSERLSKEIGLLSASKKISPFGSGDDSKKVRRSWTKEEDQAILELIQKHGQNWGVISKKIGGTRSGKQIRDRYLNKLDPTINASKWTTEEDEKLLKLFLMEGRKWCQISKSLPGRTETGVKNRFYSKFKHLISQDNPLRLENLKSEEIKKLVCSDEEEEIDPKAMNRENNSQIKGISGLNSEESNDHQSKSSQNNLYAAQNEERRLSNKEPSKESDFLPIKLEHDQLKIEEDSKGQPQLNLQSQKMELESPKAEDDSDVVLNKIEEQIISLEDVLKSSYFSLNVTQAIKKMLDSQRSENALLSSLPVSRMDLNKMVANLSMMKIFFNNTTQDIDKMLTILMGKLGEQ